MKQTKYSLLALLLVSACSTSPTIGNLSSNSGAPSCTQLGFAAGTPAYAQCLENVDIHNRVAERSLLSTAKNMPVGMLEQQHNKPMTPLINCTTYSKPIQGVPTICD